MPALRMSISGKTQRQPQSLHEKGWVMNSHEAKNLNLKGLEDVRLGENSPLINIGILREAGHLEAWYIAMDAKPSMG